MSKPMKIPFDKSLNITLKEYLKRLGLLLNVDSKYLFGYIYNSNDTYDFLDENKSIVDIRKISKKKELCFRKLT